tara:strand:- start:3160 stop:3411 length:252 start_codon:yes stop_codon:yes gene_type:complete
MNEYCIFDTESGADAYQEQALADWIAAHNEHPYVDQTTAWAKPLQRATDNKWVVPVCPLTDNSGQTIEPSEPGWFPEPEEDVP